MIYFVINKRSKAIKIGFSEDVTKRLGGLRTSSPDALTLLGVCTGDMADEKGLHVRMAHLQIRGEWFRDTPELRQLIDELCKGNKLKGRCPRCGVAGQKLHEEIGLLAFVCDDCDPPGLPRTLRRSATAISPVFQLPAGGGHRIIRKNKLSE